ncbi:MAG TPA: glycoside hydrolase family 43 protein [Chthonomonadaceae bacterium]|nr:glycoside hydrolase family 43 protein [Chthonomonadaceae bacterium]
MFETRTYTNPVYPHDFADPFVWRYQGEYYAIGTGPLEASGQIEEAEAAASGFSSQFRIFPLLRSDDFVTWHAVSGALTPPDPDLGDTFWAPEVAYHDGTFYLYYSVGHSDKDHQLRMATSRHPLGPYEDRGVTLVNNRVFPFAIDPHPFQDDDGQWYLFYASDFLDMENEARAGTALMVDRMVSMTTLAGEAKTVLRARSDWQRFQKERSMYGQTWDWHTLEGPCVRKHEGRYYCFYSGGRWETENYGVDFGVADHVLGPYTDFGNETGARVLSTKPGHLLGPGHNSIVVGPDGETEFLAYHAWNPGFNARLMCLDRLLWTPDGPRCDGPTWTKQTLNALVSPQDAL